MPIDSIKFASRVNGQSPDYQLAAFPLTEPRLAEQARQVLEVPREWLWKTPDGNYRTVEVP